MGRSKRSKNKQKNMRYAKKNSLEYQDKANLKLNKKSNRKMEKRYLIGVYDSFRINGKYNMTLNTANSKLIGSYSTEPIYNMYDLSADDVMIVKDGNHSIKMEVWEVSDKILNTIEKHYHYYEELKDEDNIYLKEEVMSPFGRIIIFTYNEFYDKSKIIVSGDWIEHLNYVKVKGESPKKSINYVREGYDKIFKNKEMNPVDSECMD